jgi:hypothetical protein
MSQETEELFAKNARPTRSNRWLVFRVVVLTVIVVFAILAAYSFRAPAYLWVKSNLSYILVALIPIVVASTAILRSHADQSTGKRKFFVYSVFWILVLLGAGASVYVTKLTADSSARAAVTHLRDQERLATEQQQRETKRDGLLHDLAAQKGIAKREDSVRIVHDKIRYIEPDFKKWATGLGDPSREAEILKLQTEAERLVMEKAAAAAKEQIRISEQSHRFILHAMEFVQRSLDAYKEAKHKDITIDPVILPINSHEKKTTYFIRLGEQAVWQVDIEGRKEACLMSIFFIKANRQYTGKLHLWITPDKDQFEIQYAEVALQISDPSDVNTNGKLEECDNSVRRIYPLVIEDQLVQAFGKSGTQ